MGFLWPPPAEPLVVVYDLTRTIWLLAEGAPAFPAVFPQDLAPAAHELLGRPDATPARVEDLLELHREMWELPEA